MNAKFEEIRMSVTPTIKVPPLESGDCLTRPEFERRYHAMPNLKKAELIEGVDFLNISHQLIDCFSLTVTGF